MARIIEEISVRITPGAAAPGQAELIMDVAIRPSSSTSFTMTIDVDDLKDRFDQLMDYGKEQLRRAIEAQLGP